MAQKELNGVLYPSKERSKETSPHFYGYATIGGVEYKISAWKNSGDKGPYVGLKFQAAQQTTASAPAAANQPDPFDINDAQNLPF